MCSRKLTWVLLDTCTQHSLLHRVCPTADTIHVPIRLQHLELTKLTSTILSYVSHYKLYDATCMKGEVVVDCFSSQHQACPHPQSRSSLPQDGPLSRKPSHRLSQGSTESLQRKKRPPRSHHRSRPNYKRMTRLQERLPTSTGATAIAKPMTVCRHA